MVHSVNFFVEQTVVMSFVNSIFGSELLVLCLSGFEIEIVLVHWVPTIFPIEKGKRDAMYLSENYYLQSEHKPSQFKFEISSPNPFIATITIISITRIYLFI